MNSTEEINDMMKDYFNRIGAYENVVFFACSQIYDTLKYLERTIKRSDARINMDFAEQLRMLEEQSEHTANALQGHSKNFEELMYKYEYEKNRGRGYSRPLCFVKEDE